MARAYRPFPPNIFVDIQPTAHPSSPHTKKQNVCLKALKSAVCEASAAHYDEGTLGVFHVQYIGLSHPVISD